MCITILSGRYILGVHQSASFMVQSMIQQIDDPSSRKGYLFLSTLETTQKPTDQHERGLSL